MTSIDNTPVYVPCLPCRLLIMLDGSAFSKSSVGQDCKACKPAVQAMETAGAACVRDFVMCLRPLQLPPVALFATNPVLHT